MTAQTKTYISETTYLAQERTGTTRHEYFEGRIYAMSGGTESHNLIAGNAHTSLHSQLRRRPCRVYQSDMRVKVIQTGLNTYPDVTVVCGQPQFTDTTRDTIINPIVIIEVLSPSTERYDRGMKFQNYRTIETLQEYILISQDDYHVECFTKQESGHWLLTEVFGGDSRIDIASIQCTLLLEDVYEKVEFNSTDPHITRDMLSD